MANPGDWLIPAGLEIEIWGEIIMQAMPDTKFSLVKKQKGWNRLR